MLFLQEMVGAKNSAGKNRSISQTIDLHKQTMNTQTFVPFARIPGYPPDPYVVTVVSELNLGMEHIRSSAKMKSILSTVIKKLESNSFMKSQNDQVVDVRLDTLMKLMISQLCIPHMMSFIGVGLNFGSNSSDNNNVATAENILVDTFSLLKYSEDLLMRKKTDVALDDNRFKLFIDLMKFKSTPLLPDCVTVKENAPSALELLACHLLSVTAVTTSIRSSIKMVVARLSNSLNNESSNYSIDEKLSELGLVVLDFFGWLRANHEQLVKLCRREEIVTSVDSNVRAWLKGENYSSASELVSVYQQKYRSALTHMPIPLQPYKAADIEQARKDVLRERIVLNKVDYVGGAAVQFSYSDTMSLSGGAHSPDLYHALRHELRNVLAFAFEIDNYGGYSAGEPLFLDYSYDDSDSSSSSNSSAGSSGSDLSFGSKQKRSGSREDAHSDHRSHVIPRLTTEHSSSSFAEKEKKSCSISAATTRSASSSLSINFAEDWQCDLLEMLCTYTLLAASRTFAGGDAFWVLSDLYGGEGLALCPIGGGRQQQSRGNQAASPGRQVSAAGMKAVPAACVVAITASGVKVSLRECYGLHLVAALEKCSDPSALQPLGRFECTTTTLIILSPDRMQQALGSRASASDKLGVCYELYHTLFTNPELICHRAVTIEPYL